MVRRRFGTVGVCKVARWRLCTKHKTRPSFGGWPCRTFYASSDTMYSIKLDHCWVCPSREGLNDHHVIPKAYGGVDGPQVTVCATHHTFIHTLSLKDPSTWKFSINEHTSCLKQRDKLEMLVGLIYKARTATRNTKKPIQVSHKLTLDRSSKLRDLKMLVGASSLTSTLDYCIDEIHRQLTQLKK